MPCLSILPARTPFLDSVNVTFITRDGTRVPVRGKVGDNVLYLAHRYNIELEGESTAVLLFLFCLARDKTSSLDWLGCSFVLSFILTVSSPVHPYIPLARTACCTLFQIGLTVNP